MITDVIWRELCDEFGFSYEFLSDGEGEFETAWDAA